MQVLVIDYGMGNLASVKRALEECGAEVTISDDPKDLKEAAKIILPGVGAFAQAMERLHQGGWVHALRKEVLENQIPILGICLGMQLLAHKGYEGGEVAGLGLVPGEVRILEPITPDTRVPHVGWNEIYKTRPTPLLDDIPDGTDFYFVHSYHFVTNDPANVLATTPYCGGITSAVKEDNIFGVQFHPEKSQRPGFQLLRNFLRL